MTPGEETPPPETEQGDSSFAEWAADLADRLSRGESVDLEEYVRERPEHAEELEGILPTIRMMSALGASVTESVAIGTTSAPGGLGTLGDFELLHEVGRGGMGIVYEAVQCSLKRRVALKVLPFASALDPRQLQRFQAEAQVVARLHHNHIVPVFATGSERGVPFYAMQFIQGRDLAQMIRERRAEGWEAMDREDFRTIAELGKQAAEALEFAHSNDVLHRDIKPSNLMVDGDGHLWITDFGLARVRGELDLTGTGDVPGTPRYMSPEQTLGRRGTIDGRSDLYSLGATLYELLAGVPPFNDDDRQTLLVRIVRDDPRPIRQCNARVPADLETIVMKAMAKDPSDRYATAREVAEDLHRYLEGRPILARRPTRLGRARKWSRRHQKVVMMAALVTILGAAGCTCAVWWSNIVLRGYNARLQAEIARADRHARESDTHRQTAEAGQRLADRLLYLATMRLGRQALELGQIERAQDILRDAAAGRRGVDDRGFAWYYLWRKARRDIVTLHAPGARVVQLAVSSADRSLATTDDDGILRLWDLIAERPRARMTREGEFATQPVFSGDGRALAALVKDGSQGQDARVVVWELPSGRRLAVFRPDPVESRVEIGFGFLARGRVLGIRSMSSDPLGHSLALWSLDAAAGSARRPGRFEALRSIVFAADGDVVLTQHDDRVVLRDPATGTVRHTLPGRFPGAGPWAVSRDGRLVAGAVPGRGVVVWDAPGGTEIGGEAFGGGIERMTFDPSGSTLVIVDGQQLVHLLEHSSGHRHVLPPDSLERQRYVRYAFSPDGTRLATCSYGTPGGQEPVTVWDVATGNELRRFPGRADQVGNLAFSADGRVLYLDGGALIRGWRMQPDDPPSPAGHADEAWSAAFSPDGRWLATGSDDSEDDDTIKIWEAATGRLVRGWRTGEGTNASLAFHPDGRTLASASLSLANNLRLWDAETGRLVANLVGHTDMVRSVAFGRDGSTVASGGSDRTVRIWDVATGQPRFVLRDHVDTVRQVAFSPDGQVVASAGNDATVRLWDAATGRSVHVFRVAAKVAGVGFTPDGRIVAAADEAGHITLWDARTGSSIRVIRAEGEDLRCLAISPDGRNIAAAGLSRTIRLWDLETGQDTLTLTGHGHQVNGLAFAPAGDELASCSHDGAVRIWRAARHE